MKQKLLLIAFAACALALLCGARVYPPPQSAKKPEKAGGSMKIVVTSVMVNDQERALKFYTEVLSFVKKTDVPIGGGRWLTVVSPEQPDGPELLLEPIGFAPAKTFQKALPVRTFTGVVK
jgi:hypothetical protein